MARSVVESSIVLCDCPLVIHFILGNSCADPGIFVRGGGGSRSVFFFFSSF